MSSEVSCRNEDERDDRGKPEKTEKSVTCLEGDLVSDVERGEVGRELSGLWRGQARDGERGRVSSSLM